MDVMLGVMKPRRLSQTMIVAIKDAERCSHAELPGATSRSRIVASPVVSCG
jgi:hypothetical protein